MFYKLDEMGNFSKDTHQNILIKKYITKIIYPLLKKLLCSFFKKRSKKE